MITTNCLNCDNLLNLEAPLRVSQRISCPSCQVLLEIINLNPLELDWIYDGPSFASEQLSLYDQDWWFYIIIPGFKKGGGSRKKRRRCL